jgi:hypothetical protein
MGKGILIGAAALGLGLVALSQKKGSGSSSSSAPAGAAPGLEPRSALVGPPHPPGSRETRALGAIAKALRLGSAWGSYCLQVQNRPQVWNWLPALPPIWRTLAGTFNVYPWWNFNAGSADWSRLSRYADRTDETLARWEGIPASLAAELDRTRKNQVSLFIAGDDDATTIGAMAAQAFAQASIAPGDWEALRRWLPGYIGIAPQVAGNVDALAQVWWEYAIANGQNTGEDTQDSLADWFRSLGDPFSGGPVMDPTWSHHQVWGAIGSLCLAAHDVAPSSPAPARRIIARGAQARRA